MSSRAVNATTTCGRCCRCSVRLAPSSPYREYTWETLSLLTRNSQARLEGLGMPSHIAETRSRIALAAFQGFIIEYFTADDPPPMSMTPSRGSSTNSSSPPSHPSVLQKSRVGDGLRLR